MADNPSSDHDIENAISTSYSIIRVNVVSSTQIVSRTSTIIDKLSTSTPPVFRLSARAKVANKLISIVDISKRELLSKGISIFQYNSLSTILADIPRSGESKEDDEEDEFETMGVADTGMKKRKIQVMTIYLSAVPIKELRSAFGEQT